MRALLFSAVAALFLAIGTFVAWRVLTHNEGTVLPGTLYRSAQLDAKSLEQEIKVHHIHTVINLRGSNPDAPWYKAETAVCRKLGVNHVDVRLSAGHLPPPEEIATLLRAYRAVPRPILLHCRSGADRTGMAACAFLIDQNHVPWKDAERALSWKYGHFAIYPYFEMDEFIQLYGQSANPSLLQWTEKSYPSVYATESHESKWDEMLEPFELLVRGRL
jgi:protein tyrosine phosphatase (PTP) superfamily phosphohydrolase (DUF442 family)